MLKRKLPIGGVQTFNGLRKDYDVYVDKTASIYDLASRYKTVFLSRPRRFGKSLLCSTIESLFRNQKDNFIELAISNTDWKWKEHPVIHLELAGCDYTENGISVLINSLNDQLDKVCQNYEINIERNEFLESRFSRIITELSFKFDQVVIIIDEYDNPLFNTFNLPEQNSKIREKLKGFYSVIKQCDQYIRFTFITGVTKFSQVSVFSGMNQAKDISMMSEYSDICGITQNELETYFSYEIEAYAPRYGGKNNYLDKLKTYYDGYCFTKDKKSVYNIYGVLNHFDNSAEFTPFWSMSGAPSFLLKFLEMKNENIVEIEEASMKAANFGDYKDNIITLYPLLYQAGYLTISDYNENTGLFKLTYPNTEVRQTLAQFLMINYSKSDNNTSFSVSNQLIKSLIDGKPDDFMNLLKIYLSKVDYSLSSKITEYYFEFAVSNIINLLGLKCKNEVHTSNGRMDSVIFAGNYIYILEFKVDKPLKNTFSQFAEKEYSMIYRDSGKTILEIGIIFNRKKRNIVNWGIKS